MGHNSLGFGVASLCARRGKRERRQGREVVLSLLSDASLLVWKCFACNFSCLLLLGCSAVTDYWPIFQEAGPLACSGLVAKATEAARCGWWVLSSINGLIRRLASLRGTSAGKCVLDKGGQTQQCRQVQLSVNEAGATRMEGAICAK